MTLDRSDRNELTVMRETIGNLLGVRRESVTQVLGLLQKDRLIERGRGRVTVLDRAKLEERVCECYAVVKAENEHLLPGWQGYRSNPAIKQGWGQGYAFAG